MILNVFDGSGNATDDDVASAIMYAADNGAAIINISLGTVNYSQILQDAVTYAFQKGSLVVAAGNEKLGGGGNLGPVYPAACSGALGVTANGPGRLSADIHYAGYGNYVGIAAPGGDLVPIGNNSFYIQYVFSTASRNPCTLSEAGLNPPYKLNYTYFLNGTSMACPHVSGAAGLYYGQNHLHQSDGFSNLKAFQALQLSADGTGKARGGGWEPTQGFGSLDVQQLVKLSAQPNPRAATVGDVTGMASYQGKPRANIVVTARQTTTPFKTYRTTTAADGTYRFVPFPGGFYDITAAMPGVTKTKRVQVTNGCDMPGVDFFVEPASADLTPPVIARFNSVNATPTTLDFDQWAFDPETEIDSATVQVGTTPGSSNLMSPQLIVPGSTKVHLGGLRLPNHYFATFTYMNGVSRCSQAVRAVELDVDDSYVSDAHPSTGSVQTRLNVTSGGSGSNEVAYIQIDISALRNKVSDARLSLTGGATGSPVLVGIYGTDNPTWTSAKVTWNNAPALSGSTAGDVAVSSTGLYTWNITALVQAAKSAGSKTVTVAIKCDSASKTGASFASIGASAGAPQLLASSND